MYVKAAQQSTRKEQQEVPKCEASRGLVFPVAQQLALVENNLGPCKARHGCAPRKKEN